VDRIDAIEREVKHDVIAFLTTSPKSSARKRASCTRA
jgi:adenylosuccinate lyase